MAIIYSKRNDNTGSHTTVDANTGSTWVGESTPLPADQVYVVGRRTTINQAAFAKWTGTITITVGSTSNFASAGFFYTVTNGGEIVKVNYTGSTATTFTGCSVDESDSFYAWNSGLTVPNGAYVHNPSYIVEVGTGETFECNELIIQEGGWFFINGGTLKINQGIILRDGRLVGRGAGTIIISRPAGTAAVSTIGYLNTENYQLSVLDIDGEENRTYATLAQQANKGDGSIVVSNVTNGSFQVGDEIAIYELNDYRFRNKGYVGYKDLYMYSSDAASNLKDMDEGLDVVGVNGNTLYVGMRNCARGQVKSVNDSGSQKVLQVKPENVYFSAGDKVVIDNNVYTIDSVEDDEFTLYDYDFTNTDTSLSDFWVDDSTHAYSAGWSIESGVGLRNTSGQYRELVHKYFWDRECVVIAEMSPLSGYSSGTRGASDFGIMTAYDPAFRRGHRGYDGFKTDYWVVSDQSADLYFYIRGMTNYNNNVPSRNANVLNTIRNPATYRIDTRKFRTIVSINGEEYTTEFRRDGNFKGLVGIFNSANVNMRCRRLTIKVPVQKLYITTENSITNGSTVYRTGIDHTHNIGSRVLKISSINTGMGNHKDLAFAYSGQNGSGIFPVMTQIDGITTTNASLPYLHNHDMNPEYGIALSNGTDPRSVTVDLTEQKTFTHVSFVPRTYDTAGTYMKMKGVAIYGSNDMTNWTTLYGPTDDSKYWVRYGYNVMGYYPTGTVSYRYVKFETRGLDYTPFGNRYVNIGVHDFSDGYKLVLNNASDINVGDTISVMTDGCFGYGVSELRGYYMAVTLGLSDIENSLHGGFMPHCTVTSKDGNTIYLDKPVWWGYVEDADSVTVIKTNRNFKITGTIGTTFDTWRFPNIVVGDGAGLARKFLLKNTQLTYIGSSRYSGSTSGNRGLAFYSDDTWNHILIDGCSIMMGADSINYPIYFTVSSGVIRNSYICSYYDVTLSTSVAQTGHAFINNKVQFGVNNVRTLGGTKNTVINYNEIIGGDTNLYLDSSLRTDYMLAPNLPEVRFNSLKGNAVQGMVVPIETFGPNRVYRTKIENNKFRGMDDALSISRSPSIPLVELNAFSDHTGARLSRYNNNGFVTYTDVMSSTTISNVFKNFNRFGYDIGLNVYYIHEKDPARPNVNRTYCHQSDPFFWAYGIELDIIDDNVPFKVIVQFDYRFPLMATLQDDGNMDGALRVYSVQNGTMGTNTYTPTPSTLGTGWNTYTQIFEFNPQSGRAGVFLNRDARNGYFEMKNMSATVYCDNPDSIGIVANTFDLNNFWDQYREKRGIKKYTTSNPTTINIRRLRF